MSTSLQAMEAPSRPPRGRAGSRTPGRRATVRVLEVDPELASPLPADRREAAAAALVAPMLRLGMGPWNVAPLLGAGTEHVGLLLTEGFLAREVVLHDQVCSELAGPGDLLRPWEDTQAELPPVQVRWNVLAPCRLLLLDRRFAVRLRDFPEVNAALFARLHQRSQRLAVSQAIAQLTNVERRVIALLWHVAGRWGIVTAEGVVVPLSLSHRLLGEMVGARRPTISSAIARLVARGDLVRRDNGTWLLPTHAPPDTGSAVQRLIPARRRLFRAEFVPEHDAESNGTRSAALSRPQR